MYLRHMLPQQQKQCSRKKPQVWYAQFFIAHLQDMKTFPFHCCRNKDAELFPISKCEDRIFLRILNLDTLVNLHNMGHGGYYSEHNRGLLLDTRQSGQTHREIV